jgi:hypothetical protein
MNSTTKDEWHHTNTIVNHHPITPVTNLICLGCAADLVNVPFVLFVMNSQRGHSWHRTL